MIAVFNLLWFVFVGWWNALCFLVLSIIFALTIVGTPIAKSMLQLSILSAFPYGKEVIREVELKGKDNVSDVRRIGGIVVNVIWFPIGLFLTCLYIFAGLLAAITIIGIPVAVVYIRLGQFLLFPIGAKVVTRKQAIASAAANELKRRAR